MNNYETFIDRFNNNDLQWLKDKKNKSHINNVVRDEELTTPQIKWTLHNFRFKHLIIKKQILDISILKNFISGFKQNNVFLSDINLIIKYQPLPDNLIIELYNDVKELASSEMYYAMWNHIPEKMLELGFIGEYYDKLLKDGTTQESMINIIKADNSTFIPIITLLYKKDHIYKRSHVYKTFLILANALFWDDETLNHCEDLMHKKHSILFYDITRNLLARSNCSIKKQAKYLLLK